MTGRENMALGIKTRDFFSEATMLIKSDLTVENALN